MNVVEFNALFRVASESNTCGCEKHTYVGWKHPEKLYESLVLLGSFDHRDDAMQKNQYSQHHPNGTNYWSENAPIAINYYPYHESEVYRCDKCSSVFLYYTEYGGHRGETRLRWVNPVLVSEYDS